MGGNEKKDQKGPSKLMKTTLKVDVPNKKCQKKLLSTLSKLEGVSDVELDLGSGDLCVSGEVDPFEVIAQARRVGKSAEVVSVGPLPPPQAQEAQEGDGDSAQPNSNKLPRVTVSKNGPWNPPKSATCAIM